MGKGFQSCTVKTSQQKVFCSSNRGRAFQPFKFASVVEALAALSFGNQAMTLRKNAS